MDTAGGTVRRSRATRRWTLAAVCLAAGSLALAACGSSSSGSSGGSTSGEVGVSLILKTLSNPFFVSMEKDAKTEAAKDNVNLTVAAGKEDGDTQTQIRPSRTPSPGATRAS